VTCLGDIPEDDPDAMYLAASYADDAATAWEEANACPDGYLPNRIIDTARRALITRIEAEIVRRNHIVEAEYRRRLRHGSIDVNGVGDVPTFYGMISERTASPPSKIDMTSGRGSDLPGPYAPRSWSCLSSKRKAWSRSGISSVLNAASATRSSAARPWPVIQSIARYASRTNTSYD
jgi:hypothetical protein